MNHLRNSVLILLIALSLAAARAGSWNDGSTQQEMRGEEMPTFDFGAFPSYSSLSSVGPEWFRNALSGSSLISARIAQARATASFMYDRAGDQVDSSQYNGYVGTLRDVFDVSLFNNISTFVGPVTDKNSGNLLSSISATNEWTATASGTWSTGGNWLGGTAPPSGGGATLVLQFDAGGATTYTATNDLGDPTTFSLNGYIFNSTSSALITIANKTSAPASTLTFVTNGGTDPTITQSGSGAVSITQGATVGAQLTISGLGTGTLSWNPATGSIALGSNNLRINTDSFITSLGGGGAITGTGGGSITKDGTNTLIMNGSGNTFSGGLTLNAGNLNLAANTTSFNAGGINTAPLGRGTLTLAGGKIQSDGSGARTIANKVTITSDVAFGSTTTQTGTLTFDAITGYTTPPTNPFTLGGAGSSQRTLTTNVGTTFVGAITETNAGTGIIKAGAGTLIFGNGTEANANTYTGLTTINAGELDLNKAAGTNAIAGNITIGDGTDTDTLKLLAANQIANTSDVTINSSGVFDLNNFSETIDALNGSAGASVLLGSATLTVGANNENSFTYAGASSGTGGLTKAGSGLLLLTGANGYIGNTTIAAGELMLGSSGSLSSSSLIRLGDTTGSASAMFDFGATGGGISLANAMIVQASSGGTRTILGLGESGNTNTYSGTITMNTNLVLQSAASGTSVATSNPGILLFQGGSIDVGTSTLTVNSNLRANNADTYSIIGTVKINEALTSSFATGGSLVKDGSGTLIIQTTSNTYTGTDNTALNANGTRIGGGVLAIFGDTSLGLAPATDTNNIFFTAPGTNVNVDSIKPTLRADAATVTLAATRGVSIASGVTGTFDNNGNAFTINGIVTGPGALVSKGAGNVTLTNANTYAGGTTVRSGTLFVNNASGSGTGTGAVTVNNTGTLAGSGFINAGANDVSINGGGSVAPGSAANTIGALTLTAANVTFGDSLVSTANPAVFVVDISGAAADLLSITGILNLVNLNDKIQFNVGLPLTAPSYTLATYTNFAGVFNDFSSVPAGYTLVYNLTELDLVATPVPEPSTWIGAGLALLAVGYTQRRRIPGLIARRV